MIRDKTFVITALRCWNAANPGDAQAMALELARDNRVLYVNPPVDWMTLLGGYGNRDVERKNRVLRGSEPAIRRISPSLWVLEPPLVVSSFTKIYSDIVYDLLNRRANRRFADVILWAMRHIGLGDHILIEDNDFLKGFYLKEFLRSDLSVYYRRENLLELDHWKRHGRRLEPVLVRKSDVVVAPNDELAEEVRGYNYNTFNIGQGVGLDGFDPEKRYRKPADMNGIPGPVIGMTAPIGTLYQSPSLLHRIACGFPHCSLVLAGAEDAVFAKHRLHELDNVYFLGEKCLRDLPAYISRFDVCISPEVRNGRTDLCYPPSVVRYLALGKNVVATATDPLLAFSREISLARDESHFLNLVEQGLTCPPDPERQQNRVEFARRHSWFDTVQKLYTVIGLVLSEREEENPRRRMEELRVS